MLVNGGVPPAGEHGPDTDLLHFGAFRGGCGRFEVTGHGAERSTVEQLPDTGGDQPRLVGALLCHNVRTAWAELPA